MADSAVFEDERALFAAFPDGPPFAAGPSGGGMEIVQLKKELSQRFARLDQRFAQMDQRFAQVDQRLARVDERFAQVEQRLDEIVRLMADDAERTRRHFDVVAGQLRDAAVAPVEEM